MTRKITNDNIYRMANAILRYNQKNKILPGRFEYGGVTFYKHEIAYIVSYVISHVKSDVVVLDYSKDYTSEGDNFGDLKIAKSDYLDMSNRVFEYIRKNKKLPKFVTFRDKKIAIDAYVIGICRALNYFRTEKKLPNRTLFRSADIVKPPEPEPEPAKKYGHATKSGCDNRGQNNSVYCGPHSLQEVFRNLTGIVVPQSTIAGWAGTGSGGTGHWGMETAVAKFNQKYDQNLKAEWKNFSEVGWNGLRNIVNSNNQDAVIHNLYRRNGNKGDGHYEVINKIYSDYCDVQNSLGSKCSYGCYCGYVEERYLSTFEYYIKGISQKSVLVITKG